MVTIFQLLGYHFTLRSLSAVRHLKLLLQEWMHYYREKLNLNLSPEAEIRTILLLWILARKWMVGVGNGWIDDREWEPGEVRGWGDLANDQQGKLNSSGTGSAVYGARLPTLIVRQKSTSALSNKMQGFIISYLLFFNCLGSSRYTRWTKTTRIRC